MLTEKRERGREDQEGRRVFLALTRTHHAPRTHAWKGKTCTDGSQRNTWNHFQGQVEAGAARSILVVLAAAFLLSSCDDAQAELHR